MAELVLTVADHAQKRRRGGRAPLFKGLLMPTPDGDDFAATLNGWRKRMGLSRNEAAQELRVPVTTLLGWLAKRPCRHEGMARRLMELLEQQKAPPPG